MQDGVDRIVQVFPLDHRGSDVATVVMPYDAEIINFVPYRGGPAIWAIVDPNQRTELRRYQMVPTGWTIPADGKYVGSATMIRDGNVMEMHFFQVPIPISRQILHMQEAREDEVA
jgi:hypothetical protein